MRPDGDAHARARRQVDRRKLNDTRVGSGLTNAAGVAELARGVRKALD